MSLAMYAAPFDDNQSYFKNSDTDYLNSKKRQAHNKTQKKYPKENNGEKFDKDKVNSVLQKIHDNSNDDEDNLGDFNPPPIAESMGVSRTLATESMQNMTNQNMLKNLGGVPLPNYDETSDLDLNNFNSNYGNNKTTEDYYNKMLPMYSQNKNTVNRQYYSNYVPNSNITEPTSNDILIQKLNYMINLLEEQQDEKTNNVTEEVVLYSFLGIFIIFVVDSFARAGKYTR
jgi:hypothetical protein